MIKCHALYLAEIEILEWLFPNFNPAVKTKLNCYPKLAVFLYVVVHVPAVQESGLHPLIWDLPSGHQAPKSAAGSRDRRAQAVRLWQVRRCVFLLMALRNSLTSWEIH